MTILEEIIAWGKKQDIWLQDALARLLKNGQYTPEDVKEVTELLLQERGIIEKTSITPIGLSSFKDTTDSGAKHSKIVLKKLHTLKNVNALTENSEIEFAEKGLTIIYGTNGSGKSGYSRVLKKCCQARSVEKVLTYAYEGREKITDEPEAAIDYSLDDGSGTPVDKNFIWKDSSEVPADLKKIWVYDKKSGDKQIRKNNDYEYIPREVITLKNLTKFITDIKEQAEKEKPEEIRIDLGDIYQGTNADKVVNDVKYNTDKNKLGEKLKWGNEQDKELQQVSRKLLEANQEIVNTKITKIEKEMAEINRLKTDIKGIEDIVSQDVLKECQELIKLRDETRVALEEIAQEMNSSQHIIGTGNELWRIMYEAAKEFAADKLPHDYKYIHIGERCVLCQQILDDEAKKRMQSFSNFANEKVRQRYDDINKKIALLTNKLVSANSKIEICNRSIGHNFEIVSDSWRIKILDHLKEVELVRMNLLSFLKGGNVSNEVHFLKSSASNIIVEIIKEAEDEKEKIKKSLDEESNNKLEAKKLELEALKVAASKINKIYNRIDYLDKLIKHSDAVEKISTRAVSKFGTEIIRKLLTANFEEKFSNELCLLGEKGVKITIKTSTSEGNTNFKFQLGRAKKNMELVDILSEGEQSIVSLAGFLAEVDIGGLANEKGIIKNAIIFDDPVTSLDHIYRERVAQRLVKEAKERQVIIFTHDLVFFHELWRAAAELRVKTCAQSIFKSKNTSGIVSSGLWEKLDIKGRIDKLKEDAGILEDNANERDRYSEKVTLIYSRLRETWERVVEEILLNGVVTRLDVAVHTQKLNGVFVSRRHFEKVYYAMSKCSKFTGHDHTPASHVGTPDVKEIKGDITKLDNFVKEIKPCRQKLAEARKKRVVLPPDGCPSSP